MTLLVGRQEGHPACKKLEWWVAGMVICLERGANLHMAQLMPLPLTVSCFSKIQIGFTFLVTAHLGSPGKGPLNGCVCLSGVKRSQEHSQRRNLVLFLVYSCIPDRQWTDICNTRCSILSHFSHFHVSHFPPLQHGAAFSCPTSSCLAFSASPVRLLTCFSWWGTWNCTFC